MTKLYFEATAWDHSISRASNLSQTKYSFKHICFNGLSLISSAKLNRNNPWSEDLLIALHLSINVHFFNNKVTAGMEKMMKTGLGSGVVVGIDAGREVRQWGWNDGKEMEKQRGAGMRNQQGEENVAQIKF